MTVQSSTRLGIVLWTGDTDPFSRDQLQTSHSALEDGILKWGQRNVVGDPARPSPSTTWKGGLFYDKSGSIATLAYTDGVEWINLVLAGKKVTGANLMLDDAINVELGTTTGTKFGTTTAQKIGFFNATPVVQQANTSTNRAALQALGLIGAGGDTRYEVRTITAGTARPSPGPLGEVIFEERTYSLLISTGAAWVQFPDACGVIKPFYGTTAPAGFLFCDGNTFNATTYAELNTMLGGNATPDLRDKAIMGRTTTGAAYSTTGQASIPATVLVAFTPDTVTSAPGGSDVQAKMLTNVGSVDNAPASAKLNYIIKS